MANNVINPPRVAKLSESDESKDVYRIARPVKYDGVLFYEGEAVVFNDPETLKLFIKNNYVV